MILLYHRVYPDQAAVTGWHGSPVMTVPAFRSQMLWLKQHFTIVSLTEYLAQIQLHGFRKPNLIAITFDDGFRETFDCVKPFLGEQKIPATFFVSTGHLDSGELLWFSYLRALCFEKIYTDLSVQHQTFPLHTLDQCWQAWRKLSLLAKTSGNPACFIKSLSSMYPVPPHVADKYAGMTSQQVIAAGQSDLVEIGGHTVTHPYLNELPKDRQAQEILAGREALVHLLRKPIRYFAYPSGEYGADTIEIVKATGFEAAFAVTPKRLSRTAQFEISRTGIYSHSLFKLSMKAMGAADLARRFGLRVS